MSEFTQMSKEQYAEMMQEKRKELSQKADRETLIVTGSQEEFVSWLDLHSRLHYSVFNSLLVHNQRKDATELMDVSHWNTLGTYIKEGEAAVQILLPDGQYKRADGRTGFRYKVHALFDVSQTNGTPKKEQFDLNMVKEVLTSDHPQEYEGKNLDGCIDLYCSKNGRDLDPFCQECAGYLLRKHYGIVPNALESDAVTYFKGMLDPAQIRSILKGIDQLYSSTVKRIERETYKKQKREEKEHEGRKIPDRGR